MKVTGVQIRKKLKRYVEIYGQFEIAEEIGINPEYLMQQIYGSRELGMRVLRYLRIKRVKTVHYYKEVE